MSNKFYKWVITPRYNSTATPAACLPLDLQLQLFDQLILPILLYGCEIWGFEKITQTVAFYGTAIKKRPD